MRKSLFGSFSSEKELLPFLFLEQSTEIDAAAQGGEPEAGRPVGGEGKRDTGPRFRQRQGGGECEAREDAVGQALGGSGGADHQGKHQ